MMSISCGLQVGYTINFPEEPETAQDNIREIGPHVMFAPPRMYEQMTRTVQVKYLDATWIKRKLYELSTRIGYHVADLKFQKKSIPWYWAFLDWLAYIAAQKKLKDHLGLSRVRNAYTGGAAMGPDHFRFFHALGVNLKQIYGQTEVAGISVVHPVSFIRNQLDERGVMRTADALAIRSHRARVQVAGVVTHRQRPETANGVRFLNLEDETGLMNVVVLPPVWEANYEIARKAVGMVITGVLEHKDGVTNLVANRLEEWPAPEIPSRDFR
mgnify:CR=1 FL=1